MSHPSSTPFVQLGNCAHRALVCLPFVHGELRRSLLAMLGDQSQRPKEKAVTRNATVDESQRDLRGRIGRGSSRVSFTVSQTLNAK